MEIFTARLIFDPLASVSEGFNEEETAHMLGLLATMNWTYLTLSWTTIYLIKYGFLVLFRTLVYRLPRMYNFWKWTLGFTTVMFAFTICDRFIACTKTEIAAGK